ncbi:MAG TPA: DUF4136 domain-containing protein [Gemmatimonadaceae bacterium]
MRSTTRMVSLALLSFAAACGGAIDVRTMAAPDAKLTALTTFRLLPIPARRDGHVASGDDDPMINNSIANRAIRAQITRSFQDRGYTFSEINPDFVVAFYATTREKLDVGMWDYGYPFPQPWPPYARRAPVVTSYTEGSVIIDVLKAGTRQLLWRGEGRAELGDDPSESVSLLSKATAAIVQQFPKASPRVVADRR